MVDPSLSINLEAAFLKANRLCLPSNTPTLQGSNLRKNFAFPLEKLAKNLLVRTNLNFSELF